MVGAVHSAITRQVRHGKEAAFEEAISRFIGESFGEPGVTGVHLLMPVPGTTSREYGILRSFENDTACEAFYGSEAYTRWEAEVAPLVMGLPLRRPLHGLEAFFREARGSHPPRWKMDIVTWLGVFPTVSVWVMAIGLGHLGFLSPVAVTAVVTAFVVATLTGVIMPLLTKVFAEWLQAGS